jgi:hypothetical protein
LAFACVRSGLISKSSLRADVAGIAMAAKGAIVALGFYKMDMFAKLGGN